jgi:urease accessory protein
MGPMRMRTEASQLLMLFNWMSPTFPIGGFAYSHGLEQAIADGLATPAELHGWVSDLLQSGSAWNDAVFFSRCWHDEATHLNALALALCGSAERYQETTQLGRNFTIAANVWLRKAATEGEIAYPVAAGSMCVTAGIEQNQALLAFLQGFCAAQISVAVRLIPLGQTKGIEVLRDLSPIIVAMATRATKATFEDLGSNCFLAEIAAMKHETSEPRVFRT